MLTRRLENFLNYRRPFAAALRFRLIAAMFLGLILMPVSAARADDAGPLHRIQLPGNPYIRSAAFSPDGETLYVLISDNAINLWSVLVHFWPEVGGGMLLVAAAIGAIAIRRIVRTPRLAGELHCRHCNYCLKAAASERCVECGKPIRRPIRGRTMRRRVLPIAIPLTILAVGYALPWAVGAPRSGWLSHWQNWWSYEVESAAAARGINLTKWRSPVDRVYELDTVGGFVRRTMYTQDSTIVPFFHIVTTPDGSGLVMPVAGSGGLGVIDTRSGRIRSELTHATKLDFRHMSGFDDSGETAYVTILDKPAKRTKLLAWNMRTGENRWMMDLEADVNRGSAWPRRIYRIPGDRLRFLELPSSMAAGPLFSTSEVRVHDCGDGMVSTSAFSAPNSPHVAPGFASNGESAFFGIMSLQALNLSDGTLESGIYIEHQPSLTMTRRDQAPMGRMVFLAHGLSFGSLIGAPRNLVLVADLDRRKWIGKFVQPNEVLATQVFESSSGRFFAIDGFLKDSKGPKGFQHELLIYDLRSLPLTVESDDEP